jgi:hypothetical protein
MFFNPQRSNHVMEPKIGLLVGREWSFPPAFIEEVNRRKAGVTAEYVSLDITRMGVPGDYAVIIDRISHEVGFYRAYLKHASLMGTKVVNNPFMWSADDKFFDASLATVLGVASPKTVVLPNKEYIPAISHSESLRNLKYPMDWKGAIEYVGLPCVLKDAHGGGWRDVYICRSLQEVMKHYNDSGLLTMVLQEFIEWDQYIRCLCLGQKEVLPMQYDPKARRYIEDESYLSPALKKRIVDDALTLVRADDPRPRLVATFSAAFSDVFPRRPADPAEKLPELSSSRPDRTVLALDIRERATLGEEHENQGGIAADAALVRRPEARRVFERPVADAGRNRDHREMGRRWSAGG